MSKTDMNRLFDTKMATSEGYAFSGENGGEAWRKKIRGHWTSQCPELRPILDYTGAMGCVEFTNADLLREAASYRWMGELNVRRLSELVWGFLNSFCGSGAGGARRRGHP